MDNPELGSGRSEIVSDAGKKRDQSPDKGEAIPNSADYIEELEKEQDKCGNAESLQGSMDGPSGCAGDDSPVRGDDSEKATETLGAMDAKGAGPDVTQAARDALADVITGPITDVVMAGVMLFDSGGTNAAPGEQIDKISEELQAVVDPAEIPSALVEKAVTHFLTPIATAAFGPIGPVIAVFAGNFAGELTHQALDADQDSAGIQRTESAIELAGAFADARIGQLAQSQPFSEYVSSLVRKPIEAIVGENAGAAAGQKTDWVTDRPPAIRAVAAAYEVDIPPRRSSRAADADSTTVRVRPASFAVFSCIPAEAVVARRRSGPHEFLQLVDGTCLQRRVDGARPGRWSRVSG